MNYIKYYKKKLNLPNYNTKLWHIHHIDMDRNNNDIENLVCIPKKLHEKLHASYSNVSELSKEKILDIGCIIAPCYYDDINEYLKVKNELYGFILARNFLNKKQIDCECYASIIVCTAKNLGYEV